MRRLPALTLVSTALLIGLVSPGLSVQAQTSAYQVVDRNRATTSAVQVQVAPGRATLISFSQTDETIAYILLADASRVVYSTDAELETGRAKTVFLRVIQPLRFPGATTAPVTNLMVQTVDARGQNRLYTFDIVHNSNPRYVGVQILPAIARSQASPAVGNLNLTPDRIQTGLSIAIMRGYTSIDDPIVAKVRQLLELMRTENMTVSEAAHSVGVPLEYLQNWDSLPRKVNLLCPFGKLQH
ncbi:MAG: TrbG/VirB9 family P-type conjugative transfer protein [Leptolyngbyaceae cyanobacterium SL_5_14]|nr:TrbG/VirB9 family P-type conjugative transfer protein [Leptolyngbyaceae cyanobacterium SL_5_14]